MSDISSLPAAVRQNVQDFARRIEVWQGVPGDIRSKFWETDSDDPYFHSASEMVQFTTANCEAGNSFLRSTLVSEFKEKLEADLRRSQVSPPEDRDLGWLTSEYLVWIDRLFFFGLITQPAKCSGGLRATRSAIALEVDGKVREGKENLQKGHFNEQTGGLLIRLRQCSGEWHPLEMIICIAAHELTHAYLHLLTRDQSASRYWRQVQQNHGHGEEFWLLLHFIQSRLLDIAPEMHILRDQIIQDTYKGLQQAASEPEVSDEAARALIHPS
ncbi:hypothetical protein F5Y16DRAFT_414283 [Xylariaceae sp. FL0255]|nr:hypothetical protein F5Y16DRAFT_414283 [Xylariaceae sp. FL0255]